MKYIKGAAGYLKEGDRFTIDSYDVMQYENTRVVSEVELLETPTSKQKYVLAEVKYLKANCLVKIKDLK